MEITITIPEKLASRAKSSGLSPDAYVERLLEKIASISAERNKVREQLRNDLLADWEHYQSTGLHLDDEEIETWLAGLEEGHQSDPPELHI